MNVHKIIFDSREIDLINFFKSKYGNDICEVRMLELGDIIIEIDEIMYVIIERKTHTDLAASHLDGRYRDQRERLLELRRNTTENKINIMYLIEGMTYKNINGLSCDISRGIFVNMMIRDNIYCYHVPNIRESVEFIYKLYMKSIEQNKLKDNNGGGAVSKTLVMSITKDKHNPELKNKNILTRMLAQIEGVSPSAADAIVKKYTTIKQLSDAYAECTTQKIGEKMLIGIVCGNGRKIGKKTSIVVYETFK